MKLRMLREEDRREGENRLAKLMQRLITDDKIDDLKAIATDEELREELFKQYGID